MFPPRGPLALLQLILPFLWGLLGMSSQDSCRQCGQADAKGQGSLSVSLQKLSPKVTLGGHGRMGDFY